MRHYYHVFDKNRRTGSLWVWCQHCGTHCHLPRVSPSGRDYQDPFEELDIHEFAALELDEQEGFLDRLDRMWDEGQLG